jgi:hypothetical protein
LNQCQPFISIITGLNLKSLVSSKWWRSKNHLRPSKQLIFLEKSRNFSNKLPLTGSFSGASKNIYAGIESARSFRISPHGTKNSSSNKRGLKRRQRFNHNENADEKRALSISRGSQQMQINDEFEKGTRTGRARSVPAPLDLPPQSVTVGSKSTGKKHKFAPPKHSEIAQNTPPKFTLFAKPCPSNLYHIFP